MEESPAGIPVRRRCDGCGSETFAIWDDPQARRCDVRCAGCGKVAISRGMTEKGEMAVWAGGGPPVSEG